MGHDLVLGSRTLNDCGDRLTVTSMKIIAIKTAVVEANFDWTFVRVYVDEGLYGTGECFFAPGLTGIIKDIAEVIVGQDPRNIDYLTRLMRRATSCAGASGGSVYHAITGIEFALWDLLGKHLKAPVWQLLGGKWRDEIRLYADSHGGHTLESLGSCTLPRDLQWCKVQPGTAESDKESFSPNGYAAMAKQVAEKGFTALKFDIDVFTAHHKCETRPLTSDEIQFQISLVKAVREAVGPKIDIAIDCHWRYNINDVLKIAWGCEPYELMWLEDPMPPEYVENLAVVSRQTKTPICTGENAYLSHGFRHIVQTNACQIIAPDFQKAGGVMEARRIADMADAFSIPIAPHCIASPIGTMQSAQICATLPNFLVLEFHAMDVPFFDALVAGDGGPVIRDGHIAVNDEPGFGIELNEEVARAYGKPGESFF
jgi:L-alanine-DL-glutamate epimerase-like enolase superfamily enzyme